MNLYIKAGFITGVFLFLRFIYMKYIEKESLTPKQFIRDLFLCFTSSVGGLFLYQNIYSSFEENIPTIFTEPPNF